MSRTLLARSIQDACERWPVRPALTHRGQALTYGQLWERVSSLAAAYRSLGIRPGDRVVCQLPTSPEHLIAVNAAWACGAVHVGAHKDLTGLELRSVVERTQAAAVLHQPPVGTDEPLAPLRAVQTACPSMVAIVHDHEPETGQVALADLLTTPVDDPAVAFPDPDDTALLLLTSGTTGKPKIIEETLRGLWAKMAFFADTLRPMPDDVHLMYLPVAHVFGLKLSLMALATGGRLVLLDRFSPGQALDLVGEEGVTILPATPTHLRLLLADLDPTRHRLDSLRWAVSAAAPLAPDLVDEVYERFGADLYVVYGCTEGFLTATADPEDLRRGSVGATVFRGPDGTTPDGTVAVRDPDRGEFLPASEVGEVVYGARKPVRYWDQPAVATDGLYRSGDLGWLDEHGRLTVSGRLKNVINRGGVKVSPVEIEAHLARHPAAHDCAVVATREPVLGEAICACIVPTASSDPPDLEALRADLAENLSRHKLPDELCVVETIPRSSVGKIDREALVERVVEGDLPRQRHR